MRLIHHFAVQAAAVLTFSAALLCSSGTALASGEQATRTASSDAEINVDAMLFGPPIATASACGSDEVHLAVDQSSTWYLVIDGYLRPMSAPQLDVHLGSLSSSTLVVHFFKGGWQLDVDPDDDVPVTLLQGYDRSIPYEMIFDPTDDERDYIIQASPIETGEAIPTIPLTIKTDKHCPPDDLNLGPSEGK